MWSAVEPGDRAVHVLTNARAHSGGEAAELVASAAAAARAAVPRRPPDPARRQHAAGAPLGGVRRAPLGRRSGPRGRTAPARARRFPRPAGSRSAASTCSSATARACRCTRPSTRATGRSPTRAPISRPGPMSEAAANWRCRTRPNCAAAPARWRSALGAAAALGRPAAVVPDAETAADLEAIADGLRAAEADGVPVIVRCAPAFAAVLTGAGARGAGGAAERRGRHARRVRLVRVGLDGPARRAGARAPGCRGDGARRRAGRRRLGRRGRAGLGRRAASASPASGLAAVATDRERDPALVGPDAQQRVARALAQVAARVPAGVVIAKGGITAGRDGPRRPRRAGGPRDRPDPARRRAVEAPPVGRPRTWSSPATSAARSSWPTSSAPSARERRRRRSGADVVRGAARLAPRGDGRGRVHLLRPRGRGSGARGPRPTAGTGVILLIGGTVVHRPRRRRCCWRRSSPRPAASEARACVQLDHCADLAVIESALEAGAGAVMADGSELPYDENAAFVRARGRAGARGTAPGSRPSSAI